MAEIDVSKNMLEFNEAFSSQLEQRDQVISDQRFVDVPGAQWDSSYGKQFANRPKMEMDKISREINRIIGEYNTNPISVKFVPDTIGSDEKCAAILQDRYRNDVRRSDGTDATDNAFAEAIKGGFGAFRLVPSYENEDDPDQDEQFIAFEPILSAASVVIWDKNARKFDKSDAKKCWVLHEMDRDLFNEEYPGKAPYSSTPVCYSSIDWYGNDVVYVAEYYEVKKRKKQRLVFERPDGSIFKVFSDDMTDDVALEVVDYTQIRSDRINTTYIEKSLICGDSVLEEPERIPGKCIPVVPVYGYRSYIRGKEYYMGEVRKQRDRQTFFNMATSMLAEIMGESHKEKPIFAPEQVAAYEHMWAKNNIENYPFLYADPLTDGNGNVIAAGPTGSTKAPEIPPALTGAIQMLNQDIAEELGTGQVDIPANTSQVAMQQSFDRSDMSYFILIHNMRKSMRRAGVIYKGMAKEVYGVPRQLRTLAEDGTNSMAQLMEPGFDETNMPIVKNDLSKGDYECVVETGKSFSSKMEAERNTLLNMMQVTDSANPLYNLMFNEVLQRIDGEGGEDIRKVARFNELQMLLQYGIAEPRNEEEEQWIRQLTIQAQQQQQQPDPMMIQAMAQQQLAQAEVLKAQTDQATVQLKAVTTQADAELKQAQTIKTYAEANDVDAKRVQEGIKLMSDVQEQQEKTMQERLRSLQPMQGNVARTGTNI